MRKFVRVVCKNSANFKSSFVTLINKMSGSTRYFVNIYREGDKHSQGTPNKCDIEKSLKDVKVNLHDIIRQILEKEPPESADEDGSLYVGAAGIAYLFLRLNKCNVGLADSRTHYLLLAERYLKSSLQNAQKRIERGISDCGFLLGDAGIIAIGIVLAATKGEEDKYIRLKDHYLNKAKYCMQIDSSKCEFDEFFVGRAGFLYGALWLNRELGKTIVPIETMHSIAKTIVASGQNYARANRSPCPLMYSYYDTEYLGAAHGLCAILQVLIQTPDFLNSNSNVEDVVQNCVDYMLSLQSPSGNFPCALDELHGRFKRKEDDELVHWCHGAPGVIYLMAAAYLRWKDKKYLESCQLAGELVWSKGLLKKGPGICHGVAGNGYVFLLLYKLTKNDLYLNRAVKFAEFMNTPQFLKEARTPDCPFSLYEGLAGTACFLADLLEPDKAAFPFQDVF